MGFYNRTSLTQKLLIYMMAIGLLPMLIYGAISILSTNKILKNETINFHKQFVDQRRQYIDLVMSDIESLISNLSGIDDIKTALLESQTDSTYKRLTTQAKIGYILSGYTNLKGLISIDVFSDQGVHFHVGETLNASNVNVDLEERLFKEASVSKDFVYWSGIEKSINNESHFPLSITAAKVINLKGSDSQNKNTSGILIISYDPEMFSEGFIKYKNEEGYSLIFDDKNRILYHPDKRYIGKTLSNNIANKFIGQEGNFEQSVEGKKTLVIYKKTQKGGWTIASQIQMNSIYRKSIVIDIIFSIILVVCILAIIAFGFIVSKSVVHPISKVTETFRLLQNGHIETPMKFNTKGEDEIGELAALFNSFIDAREDITLQKKLEKELNIQKMELQEALEKLKNTQMQMLQQEKLAGIGQLAAGVAHEINNPLGFVSSNFDIISKYIDRYEKVIEEVQKVKQLDSPEKASSLVRLVEIWQEAKIDRIRKDMKNILDDTQEGISRITNIVNGLKSFSRINKTEDKHIFNLNEGIRTTLLVVNSELKYNSDVNFIPEDIPDIYANGGQINQVILNILINAVHAIKQKFDNEKGLIVIKTYKEDMNILCSIEDNGFGMSEETIQRIFEPFFTTKPVGQGTGLGLGIAYDIVFIKHSGTISVESELGRGTKFTISLPTQNKLIKED